MKGYDVTVFVKGSNPQIWRDLIIPEKNHLQKIGYDLKEGF